MFLITRVFCWYVERWVLICRWRKLARRNTRTLQCCSPACRGDPRSWDQHTHNHNAMRGYSSWPAIGSMSTTRRVRTTRAKVNPDLLPTPSRSSLCKNQQQTYIMSAAFTRSSIHLCEPHGMRGSSRQGSRHSAELAVAMHRAGRGRGWPERSTRARRPS